MLSRNGWFPLQTKQRLSQDVRGQTRPQSKNWLRSCEVTLRRRARLPCGGGWPAAWFKGILHACLKGIIYQFRHASKIFRTLAHKIERDYHSNDCKVSTEPGKKLHALIHLRIDSGDLINHKNKNWWMKLINKKPKMFCLPLLMGVSEIWKLAYDWALERYGGVQYDGIRYLPIFWAVIRWFE